MMLIAQGDYITNIVFHERLRKALLACIEIDKTVTCFMVGMLWKTR